MVAGERGTAVACAGIGLLLPILLLQGQGHAARRPACVRAVRAGRRRDDWRGTRRAAAAGDDRDADAAAADPVPGADRSADRSHIRRDSTSTWRSTKDGRKAPRSWALRAPITEQVGGNVLPNYPPLMIVLYWLTGMLYKFALSPLFDPLLSNYSVVIRFPAIACDLVACVAVAVIAATRRYGDGRWRPSCMRCTPSSSTTRGIWGQSDGIYALWMLLALYTLARGRWFWAGVFTACAVLTKPQVAAMLPVLLVVLVRYLPRSAVISQAALRLPARRSLRRSLREASRMRSSPFIGNRSAAITRPWASARTTSGRSCRGSPP